VAFDFEWDKITHVMSAASFVNNFGNRKVYLNLHSEIALLENIKAELLEYDWSVGWNTSTSIDDNDSASDEDNLDDTTNGYFTKRGVQCDLGILYERCQANGIDNIIFKSQKGKRIYYSIPGLHHIDLYQVYSKAMVQDTIYDRAYRTHKLDDVSKALLEQGKYKGLSGDDFLKLSIKERKKYSVRDSELVMKLSKHNNFEVLDAMLAISEITGLDFEYVCKTNLTTWWGALFDQMISDGESVEPFNIFDRNKTKYKGALVLEPKQGIYHNTVVVDAASLYPTMAIHYNLSFDTINCKCCKNNTRAQVKLKSSFFKGCKFIVRNKCWICRRVGGAFPKKLKIFRRERLQQKKQGNKAKQLALKILINGGYGVFGHTKFRYYNPMVAELVTTYGRYTLAKMQGIAKRLGFQIIYGDTDSLFLNKLPFKNSLNKFQELCREQLDIEIEVKNNYSTLILSSGKKHYIGYENGLIDIVGYEGKKSDRCEFVKGIFNDVITGIVKSNANPVPNLAKAMRALESGRVNPKLLKKSIRLGQNPMDYASQTCQAAKIGTAVGAKKGELVEYFDSSIKKTGRSWSKDYRHIDILKYKQTLWNSVREILEITGYATEDLARKFGVKTFDRNKNGHDMQNLPAV
jgi:DNA polymerase, archaea type